METGIIIVDPNTTRIPCKKCKNFNRCKGKKVSSANVKEDGTIEYYDLLIDDDTSLVACVDREI